MSDVKSIESNELKAWLASGEAILVDVREPDEFTKWRIPLATSMPLTNIDKNIDSLKDEKRKIVFQCLKGKRGEMAAQNALAKLGSSADIYNLVGGIEAWDASGGAIIRDGEKKGTAIPIFRQVLITAGSLAFIFSLLALLGVKLGTVLTLFLGVGMIFAGVTGNCAMATLLQKMPWNQKN